jgi:hypothetical protein
METNKNVVPECTAFEQWMSDENLGHLLAKTTPRIGDGEILYLSAGTQHRWVAWQGCAAAAMAPATNATIKTGRGMNDRDLLELAAKAAGYEITSQGNDFWLAQDGQSVKHWSPLADDSDALRLAVKLEIGAVISSSFVYVVKYYKDEPILRESLGSDHYAATRRAIVRAAAEIGRNSVASI